MILKKWGTTLVVSLFDDQFKLPWELLQTSILIENFTPYQWPLKKVLEGATTSLLIDPKAWRPG